MAFQPTLPLSIGMGLRQPRMKLRPLLPRAPPSASYPHYHPLRAQYPHPAVHFLPKNRQPDHTTPVSHGPPTHYRITLHRSALAMPEEYGKALAVLGLSKKDQTTFHPFSAQMAGTILKVKELVQVRNVSWWQMEDEMKRGRGQGKGFQTQQDKSRSAARSHRPESWTGNKFTL